MVAPIVLRPVQFAELRAFMPSGFAQKGNYQVGNSSAAGIPPPRRGFEVCITPTDVTRC